MFGSFYRELKRRKVVRGSVCPPSGIPEADTAEQLDGLISDVESYLQG